MCRLPWNLGASTSWKPQGLSRPVMGLLYLYLLMEQVKFKTFSCTFKYQTLKVFVWASGGRTNFMEYIPFWEATSSSASHKFPPILWTSEFHYHICESPPPVGIQSIPSPLSQHYILILFSHPLLGLPSGLFPSVVRIINQWATVLRPRRPMPRQYHCPWFHHRE